MFHLTLPVSSPDEFLNISGHLAIQLIAMAFTGAARYHNQSRHNSWGQLRLTRTIQCMHRPDHLGLWAWEYLSSYSRHQSVDRFMRSRFFLCNAMDSPP